MRILVLLGRRPEIRLMNHVTGASAVILRILVTGGAGYLGSVLIGYLLWEGHSVRYR